MNLDSKMNYATMFLCLIVAIFCFYTANKTALQKTETEKIKAQNVILVQQNKLISEENDRFAVIIYNDHLERMKK